MIPRHVVDAACGVTAVVSVIQWLPPTLAVILSIFGIAWYSVALWESRTFTSLRMRWRGRGSPDAAS